MLVSTRLVDVELLLRAKPRAVLRGRCEGLAQNGRVKLGDDVRAAFPPRQVPALDTQVPMVSGDVAKMQGLGQIFGVLLTQTQANEVRGAPPETIDLTASPRVQVGGLQVCGRQAMGPPDTRRRT